MRSLALAWEIMLLFKLRSLEAYESWELSFTWLCVSSFFYFDNSLGDNERYTFFCLTESETFEGERFKWEKTRDRTSS